VKRFNTVLEAVGYAFEHGLHKPQDGEQPDLVFQRNEDGKVELLFKEKEDGKRNGRDAS
jgi:hypothetical protein